jgi:predicted small lipoprotein YifL
MEMPLLTRFALVAGLLALAGCPTESPTGDTGPLTFPDCEAIVEACHDVDDGSGGMPTTCHDTAHDATSNADCAPLRASCVAACSAIDGGVLHAEDAPGHTHDEDAPAHTHDEDAGTDGGSAP